MNKEEIEQKLNKILDNDEELLEDLIDGKIAYNIGITILQDIAKQAFNLALELAAENAEITYISKWDNDKCVDKQSILNLKFVT